LKRCITAGQVGDFPYTPAVVAGGLCFVAGQLGVDGDDTLTDGLAAQTEQALRNLEAVLAAAGGKLQDVVRTSVWLRSYDDFEPMNEVYRRFFPSEPLARITLEVSRLPPGAVVEVDAIAVVG
jgi:2-iminobutanoate/2-iminopropanoate deaminase